MPRLAGTLTLLAVGFLVAAEPGKPSPTDQLAKTLAGTIAGVTEKDVVLISGEARDLDLLESLWVASARTGAEVMVRLNPSPKTSRRLLLDVPEKFDAKPRTAELALADKVTVTFTMESTDYGATKDLPAARVQARNAREMAVIDKHTARNVRQVFIGNGLYPTDFRAKELGLSKAELEATFKAGLSADYAALQKTAAGVKATFAGKQATVTSPHGTKLTVGLDAKSVIVNDGVITPEKAKAGGAAAMVWLPAGEVYARTLPGTATGTVVVPSVVFENEVITNLELTFEKGKLAKMKAPACTGYDRLQATFKASADGKELLSVIDVGVNAAVKFPASARDVAYPAGGTVTVYMGGDTWAGGTNKSTFGLPAMLRDATLTVDGKEVVKAGELAK